MSFHYNTAKDQAIADNDGKELHVEVARSTALDRYISQSNSRKGTARGHFEVETASKQFQFEEKELDAIHQRTAMLVETLLCDYRCRGAGELGARI